MKSIQPDHYHSLYDPAKHPRSVGGKFGTKPAVKPAKPPEGPRKDGDTFGGPGTAIGPGFHGTAHAGSAPFSGIGD